MQRIELAPKGYSLKRSLEIPDIQAEAIKKFWESLKEIAYLPNLSITGEFVVGVRDGDDLVKEMVGDAE